MPAGTYHIQCDSIIIRPVDVTFQLLHRRLGELDIEIARWDQHFEPLPDGVYEAQAYEVDQEGIAVDFEPGDQLVFRFTGNSTTSAAFIPNGDGELANGRIPAITLPP